MDKKEHRVCDVCDHMMSNIQFKNKLQGDIERKKAIGKEVKTQIQQIDKKLKGVTLSLDKERRLYESKVKEVITVEKENAEKVRQAEDKVKEVEVENVDLQQQLKELDGKLEMLQKKIDDKQKINDDYKDKKSDLKGQIDEYNAELKNKNSALMQVQKIEFSQSFVPQQIERGQVDPSHVKEWQNKDSSEDTSKEEDN